MTDKLAGRYREIELEIKHWLVENSLSGKTKLGVEGYRIEDAAAAYMDKALVVLLGTIDFRGLPGVKQSHLSSDNDEMIRLVFSHDDILSDQGCDVGQLNALMLPFLEQIAAKPNSL